jgi:signal transduction histidine kinase
MNLISKKKKYILFIDIIIILICIAGLYQSTEKAGINILLKSDNHEIVVLNTQYPFQVNDRIVRVDDFSVSTLEDIEFILDSYAIGDQVDFTVLRNGMEVPLKTDLIGINSFFYLISLCLAGAIFLGLGIFVLLSRPTGDIVALIFHWISATVCIHIITTFGRYTVLPFNLGYVLRIIFFLASSLTPVLFLHLSFLFPKEKKLPFKWMIKGLYGFSFLSFLFISFLFLRAGQGPSIAYFHNFMSAYNIGRWIFAMVMILGFVNFIHSYFRALEESERRKLRWVILGLGIGPLGFIFLWQIPQILTSVALVPEEVILLISSLTPLAFAISIVRYHILDIDIIFNRSTVYFLVLIIVLVIYTAIVALSAFLLGTFTIKASLITSAIASVIIALLFEPARIRVQQFVDKKFFRIRYNYRLAQREFTQQIHRFYQISSLSKFVIDKLYELLMIDHLGLYTLDKDNRWILSAGINISEPDNTFQKIVYDFGKRSQSPLYAVNRFMEAGIDHEAADNTIFKPNKIALVATLRIQNTPVRGFILLGPKKSRLPFTREDIDLIRTVSSETSFAIERIRMQGELMIQEAETRRLDEINRLKSYFVSSVSHDLQTPLTSIKMFAEILQNNKKISEKDKTEYLNIIQGETDRLSRLINNVLDFSRIERGEMKYNFEQIELIPLIESILLTMHYQLKQNQFKIETSWPEKLTLVADKDALAAALINLISNVIKYSEQDKYLKISTNIENGYVVIGVEDHGIGISEKEQEKIFDTFYRSSDHKVQALGGAGLGLTLVQHIVEAHKGKIKVISVLGKGTRINIHIPVGKQI